MKIAIIGTGAVGTVLGKSFTEKNHDVIYGSRNSTDEKKYYDPL